MDNDGKIFVTQLVEILEMNNVKVDDDELIKIGKMADKGGEITRNDFFHYLKTSRYWDKELAGRELGAKVLNIEKNLKKMSKTEEVVVNVLERDNNEKISRSEFAMISKKLDDQEARYDIG